MLAPVNFSCDKILINDYLASSPGNISPTTAQQTMSYAPPLLRLAGQLLPVFLATLKLLRSVPDQD